MNVEKDGRDVSGPRHTGLCKSRVKHLDFMLRARGSNERALRRLMCGFVCFKISLAPGCHTHTTGLQSGSATSSEEALAERGGVCSLSEGAGSRDPDAPRAGRRDRLTLAAE